MFAAICGYVLTLQHTEPVKWSDQGNQNSHDLQHLSFIYYFLRTIKSFTIVYYMQLISVDH